ncbi:LAMI_0C00386g1_1 [Lachancea mirantina]|uniref:LAMI_0C00386g1_1 n=1 Tax=Lachancea mirantina TaxID=1230905 RepID=A0A1G4IZH6_9SACH|nr:LAMI_0C00386g1_1 [Lachancea mirantina]
MVLDTVVYHPSVSRVIKLLDSTAGREKVLRLLQYLCRFLGFQYSILLAKHLQAQFTTIRKVLRFLKPLNHLQAASRFYDNKISGDNIARWCNVFKNVAYAGYLTLDQVNLLRILKLVPVTKTTGERVPRWANWFWFAGLLSGLVLDFRRLYVSQERIKTLIVESQPSDEKKLLLQSYEARKASLRRLVWDSLDTFIVLNNLKFLKYPDGSIGLAGVATSLLGLQDLWKAAI